MIGTLERISVGKSRRFKSEAVAVALYKACYKVLFVYGGRVQPLYQPAKGQPCGDSPFSVLAATRVASGLASFVPATREPRVVCVEA